MAKANINTPANLIKQDIPYSMLPHDIMRDDSISFDARGLWALMNGYADGWKFNKKHLMNVTGWGRDKLNNAIRALKDVGLLAITPTVGAGGKLNGQSWSLSYRGTENPQHGEDPPHKKNNSKKNNSNKKTLQKDKELSLEGGKQVSNPEEVFDKLWSEVLSKVPKSKKSYFSKKISRTRFDKIVKRRNNPISATRLANAILWFYSDVSQTREDRKYMKALQYVLKDELFYHFLHKGAYEQSKAEFTEDDLWAARGKTYLLHGWDHQWIKGHSRNLPERLRKHFPKADYKKLGWTE